MLAALSSQETCVFHRDVSRLRPQVPIPDFKAACRELCARIWIELELLAQAAGQVETNGRPRDITMSAAILRLELIMLVDSCRSVHWRSMLSVEQCDCLCSMLTDVLAALYVESEHLSGAIPEAQDRVLFELLTLSGARSPLADPAPVCEIGQGSSPAINELLRLIEAQAAARGVGALRRERRGWEAESA